MPIKKNLIKLANSMRKQANIRASQSDDKLVRGAAKTVSVLPYTKLIVVGSVIAVVVILLMSMLSGVQNAFDTLTRSNADCDPIPNISEISKYFDDQGQPLSSEQKASINEDAAKANNGCEKQGIGFNGEVYPPTTGRITAFFNQTSGYAGGGQHKGMDIAGQCNDPIYAFAGGEVTKVVMGSEAKSSSIAGTWPMGEIIIKHSENFSTRILHVKGSTTTVKVGDLVTAGQQIATQWSNGPSTGCHLHIEAHVNGERADMNDYLKGCGFEYSTSAVFNTFPEAPVVCSAMGGVENGTVPAGSNEEYAKAQMAVINSVQPVDITNEFTCLRNLWNRESNWRVNAQNNQFDRSAAPIPENQAYGIPQAAPGRKMASEGADWKTNPQTQIRWGLKYIDDRYGTPCGAWAHSEAKNWY